jgi:hypothetical protein
LWWPYPVNEKQLVDVVPVEVLPIGLWEGQLTRVSDNSSIAVAGSIALNGEIRFIPVPLEDAVSERS